MSYSQSPTESDLAFLVSYLSNASQDYRERFFLVIGRYLDSARSGKLGQLTHRLAASQRVLANTLSDYVHALCQDHDLDTFDTEHNEERALSALASALASQPIDEAAG